MDGEKTYEEGSTACRERQALNEEGLLWMAGNICLLWSGVRAMIYCVVGNTHNREISAAFFFLLLNMGHRRSEECWRISASIPTLPLLQKSQ